MKAAWKEYRFGDCATLLSGGTPSKSRNDYWEGDLPWVSCKDMKVDRIYDAEDHLSSLGAESGTRVVPKNTILFVVRGMILAKNFPIAITKRPVAFNQDLKAVTCADFVETEFLYYWLKANSYEILGRADEAGHGTKRIQTDRLLSLPIRIPPPLVQRQIASILSTYDDLIENNQRRIKILEEMARSLYREWFIHFRFPGHDKVKMVSSPLGPIPQGWEVSEFRNLFQIKYGKTLPKSEIMEQGQYPVYGAGDVIGYYDSFLYAKKCALVTSRGNGSGTVWRTREAAFVTNNSLIILPQDRFDYWDYSFVELLLKHSNVMEAKTGSAQPQVTIENLNYVKGVVPSKAIVERFCRVATPLYEQVDLLFKKCDVLRRTRDLLLPRLLSGQVALTC